MAILAVLGGLIGGALVLALLRSKRNSSRTNNVQTFHIR